LPVFGGISGSTRAIRIIKDRVGDSYRGSRLFDTKGTTSFA
jgi:hypothetical protein